MKKLVLIALITVMGAGSLAATPLNDKINQLEKEIKELEIKRGEFSEKSQKAWTEGKRGLASAITMRVNKLGKDILEKQKTLKNLLKKSKQKA